jgi:hypothetical protein
MEYNNLNVNTKLVKIRMKRVSRITKTQIK